MVSQERQRTKNLDREPSNQTRRESCETVRFDEFVEIDAQEFGDDAKMTSERE